MPVQVYLDSSDYSTLSNETCSGQLKTLRKNLIDLRESGACEFRFSYVHIIEMTPVDQASLPFATSRLGLLQELCGKKCFLPTDALDREELLAALIGISSSEGPKRHVDARSDMGDWLPGGFEFLEKHADGILNTIAAMRKSAKERGLRDQRKINFAIQSLLTTQLDGYSKKLPMSAHTKERLLAKSISNLTKDVAIQMLRDGFTDFPLLADWAAKSETGRQFTSLLRSRAVAPLEDLGKARSLFKELRSVSSSDRIGRQRGVAAINKGFDSTVAEYRNDFVLEIFAKSQTFFELHGFTLSAISQIELSKLILPRLDTHIALYEENLRRNATTDRNLTDAESDMGDILHANYLPYTNIIRADSFSSEVCKRLAKSFLVQVVPDLLHLPRTIQEYSAVKTDP